MAWPPRFLFIANRLCIDFALTGGEGERARWERWKQPADLADWFAASSLALPLRTVQARHLRSACELREAIWSAAQACLRGRRPASDDRRVLEAAAARPDLVPVWKRGETRWSPESTADQALATLARDALWFFGSEARARLRECRNPRCPLIFVDTSRPGRRAWCAMRRCGNLEKTSRYRRRRRDDEPDAGAETG